MARKDQTDSPWSNRTWLETTPRPVLVDYSGLKVHQRASEVLKGQAGYRPLVLVLAALIFVSIVLLPVPGSLIDLVEEVNPPGYDMMEPGTETVVDSVNYHRNPEAFEAWRQGSGSAGLTCPR